MGAFLFLQAPHFFFRLHALLFLFALDASKVVIIIPPLRSFIHLISYGPSRTQTFDLQIVAMPLSYCIQFQLKIVFLTTPLIYDSTFLIFQV